MFKCKTCGFANDSVACRVYAAKGWQYPIQNGIRVKQVDK